MGDPRRISTCFKSGHLETHMLHRRWPTLQVILSTMLDYYSRGGRPVRRIIRACLRVFMKNSNRLIERFVAESVRVKTEFFRNNADQIAETARTIARALRDGQKVLLFGNGGSAADAQHITAEFIGRFLADRKPLPALSLATDTSVLTALGNDYGYNAVFSRQIQALGTAGDVAIGISTSGKSPSVLDALDAARARALFTVGFTGQDGGNMTGRVDVLFCVPSSTTARIQETHLTLGHILCELIDRELFPEAYPQE
jgi:D-sedoheptulose 7-phosphate isomerase